MMKILRVKLVFITFAVTAIFAVNLSAFDLHTWNEKEKAVIRSLWIGSLPALPKNPSNAFADNPEAAALGKKFFFDDRFSGNMKVSCATCHPANMNFADNLPLAHGVGTTTRRTMPLIGAAYYTWLFWDGRKDSLWSQALGPIESPVEHGFTRTRCASVIQNYYRNEYEAVFGPLPEFSRRDLPPIAKPSLDEPSALKAWVSMPLEKKDAVNRLYANMGKAIAAFVRTILPGPSRFDRYAEAVFENDFGKMNELFSNDEAKGLRLFIGKAKCTNCHTGPLFTNGDFHNTGVPQPGNLPEDRGREDAIPKVLADEFNCVSVYSDAGLRDCSELRFIDARTEKYNRAFKTPTLRNVAERAPYMHAGQFSTLRDVLEFYGQSNIPDIGHGGLNMAERAQLEGFLRTLSGPVQFAE